MVESKQLIAHSGVELNALNKPNDTAVIFGERRITWHELDERANRVANAFINMGLSKGDKITILSFNCSENLELFSGLNKAGFVAVPMNFRIPL